MALASSSLQTSSPVTLDVSQAVVLSIAALLEHEPECPTDGRTQREKQLADDEDNVFSTFDCFASGTLDTFALKTFDCFEFMAKCHEQKPVKAERSQKAAQVPISQPAPQQQEVEAGSRALPASICAPFIVQNTFLQLRTDVSESNDSVGARRRASSDFVLFRPMPDEEEDTFQNVTEGLQSLDGAAAALWLRSQERAKSRRGSFAEEQLVTPQPASPQQNMEIAPPGLPCLLRSPWADVPSMMPEKQKSTGEAEVACKKAPKKKSSRTPKAPRTTTVLRNLPVGCTRASLLAILDANGLRGAYDFVYLPFDFDTGAMFGYAFVNWTSHEVALRVWQQLPLFEVSWSDPYQGLDAHLKRYTNSSVMHGSVPDERKPILFFAGERVAFPKPTRRIKAPRARPPPREIKRDRVGHC